MENRRKKRKPRLVAFLDLDKSFDGVLNELALRGHQVSEQPVNGLSYFTVTSAVIFAALLEQQKTF